MHVQINYVNGKHFLKRNANGVQLYALIDELFKYLILKKTHLIERNMMCVKINSNVRPHTQTTFLLESQIWLRRAVLTTSQG